MTAVDFLKHEARALGIVAVTVSAVGKGDDNKRDKYERILAAARELFGTTGYDGTTMAAIAQRAGVSKGAVFFHTTSKAAVLNRVFQLDTHAWVEAAFERHDEPDVLDDLVAKFAALMSSMGAQPELAREYMRSVAFALDERERRYEAVTDLTARVQAVLDRARTAGAISRTADTAQLAWNLFALYFVVQMAWLSQGDTPSGDPADHLRPAFSAQLAPLLRRSPRKSGRG